MYHYHYKLAHLYASEYRQGTATRLSTAQKLALKGGAVNSNQALGKGDVQWLQLLIRFSEIFTAVDW